MSELLVHKTQFAQPVALLAQEQFHAVIDLLQPQLVHTADSLDESLLVLLAYVGLHDFEHAERLSLRMMSVNPDDLRANYARALYLYHTKLFTLGQFYVQKALKHGERHADVLALAGALAFENKATADAEKWLDLALAVAPQHPLALATYKKFYGGGSDLEQTAPQDRAPAAVATTPAPSVDQSDAPHASSKQVAPQVQKAPATKPRLSLAQMHDQWIEWTASRPQRFFWSVLAAILVGVALLALLKPSILGVVLALFVWFPIWWWSSTVYSLLLQPGWYKPQPDDKQLPVILGAVLLLTAAGFILGLAGMFNPVLLTILLACWIGIYVLSYYQAYRNTRALFALAMWGTGFLALPIALFTKFLSQGMVLYPACVLLVAAMFLSYTEDKS
jgi:hypothetical protein